MSTYNGHEIDQERHEILTLSNTSSNAGLSRLYKMFQCVYDHLNEDFENIFETQISDEERRRLLQGEIRDPRGRTLIHLAVFVQNEKAVKYLADKKATVRTKVKVQSKCSRNSSSIA